jgi:uncharacterized protein
MIVNIVHINTLDEIRTVFQRFFVFLLCGISIGPTHAEKPAQLAIIIDDIGYNLANGRKAAELPIDITLAVLPFTPHGKSLAELGHRNGKEIMLHAPMSNEHDLPLGPGALTGNTSKKALKDILDKNLLDIPYVKGVNNHMGSQLTQNAEVMGWLMEYLKDRKLYFIDSRTTAKTVALDQAKTHQLPSRKRDVFLDDIRSITHIRQQLEAAITIARQKGSAIAIGHPYPETLSVLSELASATELQVKLVDVSALLELSDLQPFSDERPYCPITLPPEPPNNSPFVMEPILNLRNASHKNSEFVIKKI